MCCLTHLCFCRRTFIFGILWLLSYICSAVMPWHVLHLAVLLTPAAINASRLLQLLLCRATTTAAAAMPGCRLTALLLPAAITAFHPGQLLPLDCPCVVKPLESAPPPLPRVESRSRLLPLRFTQASLSFLVLLPLFLLLLLACRVLRPVQLLQPGQGAVRWRCCSCQSLPSIPGSWVHLTSTVWSTHGISPAAPSSC